MSITRISTYGNFQKTTADFQKVSAGLSTLQQQISSGVKAQDFKGLNGFVEQFTGLEATQKKQQQYIDNNSETLSRLGTQKQAVTQSVEIATQLQSLLTVRRSAAGKADNIGFQQNLDALRDTLSNQLNTQLGGRYLFGGSQTNQPPVLTNPTPEPSSSGTPDSGYYQGASTSQSVRPSADSKMELSVRADDPAFQKIYAGIALAKQGDGAGSDELIARAYDLIEDGFHDLVGVQAKLDNDTTTIKEINSQHESSNLYLKGITEDIAKTDLVKATSQLATDQTILQAAFQAFAAINNLQLANFLK